jgi:hypothetical protein
LEQSPENIIFLSLCRIISILDDLAKCGFTLVYKLLIRPLCATDLDARLDESLGFLKYGYTETAERIKHGILELVSNHGFIEYYDTYTREGLGGKLFSWAALVIDMIKHWDWNSIY